MTQFRTLPVFGANERQVSEVVRGLMDGKSNNTGTVTLATGGATSTTIYDERIGYDSVILFMPITANAASDSVPYGAFEDTTTQTASANTATVMTLNTTDYADGISVVTSGGKASRITVKNAGVYNFQWSGQFQNSDNQLYDATIWLRKNGTDIAGSSGLISIPNSHGGVNGHGIYGWNYYLQLSANDYIELWWSTDSTQVTIQYYSAGTSPTRPTTASLIATMQYVNVSSSSNMYVSNRSQGQATLNHFANSTADKTYGYIVVG
jgi:hypothetical protein